MGSMECDEGRCMVKDQIIDLPAVVSGHSANQDDDQVKEDMAFSVSVIAVVLVFLLIVYWIVKSRIRLFRAIRIVGGIEDGGQQQQPQNQPQQQQQNQSQQQHQPQQSQQNLPQAQQLGGGMTKK